MVGSGACYGFGEGVVDLEDGFFGALVGLFKHANEFFKSGFGSRPLGNRKWVSKLINDYFSSIRNRLHKRLARIAVETNVYFGGDFVGEVEELLAGGDGHEEVFGSFIGCGFDDA